MKHMNREQMLNVLDEYIQMLEDVYGAGCSKRKYASKDMQCQMAHRLLKEIRETADILRNGTHDEQRMITLVLMRNQIMEVLTEDLEAYRLKEKNKSGTNDGNYLQ